MCWPVQSPTVVADAFRSPRNAPNDGEANAQFRFAPAEGPAFFESFGWSWVHVESRFKAAVRTGRGPLFLRLLLPLLQHCAKRRLLVFWRSHFSRQSREGAFLLRNAEHNGPRAPPSNRVGEWRWGPVPRPQPLGLVAEYRFPRLANSDSRRHHGEASILVRWCEGFRW